MLSSLSHEHNHSFRTHDTSITTTTTNRKSRNTNDFFPYDVYREDVIRPRSISDPLSTTKAFFIHKLDARVMLIALSPWCVSCHVPQDLQTRTDACGAVNLRPARRGVAIGKHSGAKFHGKNWMIARPNPKRKHVATFMLT